MLLNGKGARNLHSGEIKSWRPSSESQPDGININYRLIARATAAATAAASTPAATAEARTAGRFGARFIYVQGPAVELGAVQLRNGRFRIALFRHLDEGEAARLARVAV